MHYKHLKWSVFQGMELTMVHRIVCLKQKPWVKQPLCKNIRIRSATKNLISEEFYK